MAGERYAKTRFGPPWSSYLYRNPARHLRLCPVYAGVVNVYIARLLISQVTMSVDPRLVIDGATDNLTCPICKAGMGCRVGQYVDVKLDSKAMHSDGHYYFKGRLLLSSPWRDNLIDPSETITLTVLTLTGKTITLRDVRPLQTILSLKKMIQDGEWRVPVRDQRLIYAGSQLEDMKTCCDYHIFKDAILHLVYLSRR